jgi:hypothetical protein
MKIIVSCLAVAASVTATAALAACEMPSLVASIPDGATATEQELLAAQAQVKAYVEAMDGYIACQNEETAQASDDGVEPATEFYFQMSTRVRMAREEVDAIATRFNEQVNAFRAARQTVTAPASLTAPPP